MLLPPKKQLSAADARRMIERAVAEGAPLFNAGHPAACAKIYMQTMQEMVDNGDQMPEHLVTTMKEVLNKAKHTSSAHDRAWMLRHGLDHAYARMRESL